MHISCHGLHTDDDKSDQKLGMNLSLGETKDVAHDNNYLLFENNFGVGTLISASQLLKLIKSTMTSLELVFVAACDSEIVGEIF